MPVVQVGRADNRAQYEAVASQLDMAWNRPQGLILHAACETNEGDVQIVDVWESAEAAQAVAQERLFPIFEAVGIMETVLERGAPSPYEAFDLVR